MKKIKIIIALFLLAGYSTAFSQEITMFSVISLSKSDNNKCHEYLLANKWKFIKAFKLEPKELQDIHGKYAHFTNCFFMLPEYKEKFTFEAHSNTDGVFRDVYCKGKDSVLLYYYKIKDLTYPAGLLYKTNRVKLQKIEEYLQHNNYSQTFARDSIVIYQVKHATENVTIDKTYSPAIEYYIDRCWRYVDQNSIMDR